MTHTGFLTHKINHLLPIIKSTIKERESILLRYGTVLQPFTPVATFEIIFTVYLEHHTWQMQSNAIAVCHVGGC